MGFRLFSGRWIGAAAAFAAPLMAFGFYASHPEHLGIAVSAAISGVGSVHARRVPANAAGRGSLAREAEHLFSRPFKGPRADRYMQLTRSERGLQPVDANVTKVAKAPVQADMMVTGSIPRAEAMPGGELSLPGRGQRADMMLDGPRPGTFLVTGPTGSGKSTTLASLEQEQAELDTELPSQKKTGKRLAFKGETETEYQTRQRRCLATAIYFEARGEPVEGQIAVAQVVMNRVRSSLYPDTICGVVYQGQHRRTGCQFSFTCDGKADVAKDKERWRQANEIAYEFTQGETFLGDIGQATNYHANYVSPRWRWGLNRIKKVGQHIFYKVKGEQIEDVLKEGNPARGLALAKSG